MTAHHPNLAAIRDYQLRTDFLFFISAVFRTVNPGAKYLPGTHIAAIAWALKQLEAGVDLRLLITIAPRSLKSIIVNVAWPAWLLGHDPTLRIISASYSLDLAYELSRATRTVMESDWYRRVFPNTLDSKGMSESQLRTRRQGYRMATSVGGTLTGKGGDIIMVDDPLSADDAYSQAIRDRGWEWFSGTLMTRLDNPKAGKIVVISQRLHVEDIPGRLIASGGWKHLNLPMVAGQEPSVAISDSTLWDREPGDLLHPERLGQKEIDRLRKEFSPEVWESQYQQRPVPPGGGIFKLEEFKRYPARMKRRAFEAVIVSLDTALSTSTTSDFTAATVWGILGDDVYLLDAERGRFSFNEQIALVDRLDTAHRADKILIEKAASGHLLIEELRRGGRRNVLAYDPKDDKIARAHAVTAKIRQGKVHLPGFNCQWMEGFMTEVGRFPNGKNDDWVDSMTQFLRSLDHGYGDLGLSVYGKVRPEVRVSLYGDHRR